MVKKLKSQFSFGFELEAILDRDVQGIDTMKETFDKFLGGKGDLHHDGSISSIMKINSRTFEYATPVMQYNPKTVSNAIKFLDNLRSWGVYVNSSCGFHTHISFPDISKTDVFWFVMWLCGTGTYHTFDRLGRTNLFNKHYASPEFLSEIENCLMRGATAEAYCKIMTNDKYRSIRIHPQGTIEWRGPRTFLNNPTHKKNITFFQKLDLFISSFVESMNCDSFETNGYIYSKKELEKFVTSASFKEKMEVMFKEHCKNHDLNTVLSHTPEILEKIPFKSLVKNDDVIVNILNNNYSVLSYGKYRSKNLLKFILESNDLNNKHTLIHHLFPIDFVINNANKLYEMSLLSRTIGCYNMNVNNIDIVLPTLKTWSKEGKYNGAIKQLVKKLLSDDTFLMYAYEFIENGVIDVLGDTDKMNVISKANDLINNVLHMYNQIDTERRYLVYKLRNLLKEKGYFVESDTLPY